MPEPRWSLFHEAFNHRWLTDLLLEHGPSSSLGCPCLIRAIILNIRIVSPPHGNSSVKPPSHTQTSASSTRSISSDGQVVPIPLCHAPPLFF